MKNYDHEWAIGELKKLDLDHKFDTMIKVGKGAETEEESEQIMKWFNEVEGLLDN